MRFSTTPRRVKYICLYDARQHTARAVMVFVRRKIYTRRKMSTLKTMGINVFFSNALSIHAEPRRFLLFSKVVKNKTIHVAAFMFRKRCAYSARLPRLYPYTLYVYSKNVFSRLEVIDNGEGEFDVGKSFARARKGFEVLKADPL